MSVLLPFAWLLLHGLCLATAQTCQGYNDGDVFLEAGFRYQVHCSTDVYEANIGGSSDNSFTGCAQTCNEYSSDNPGSPCAAGVVYQSGTGQSGCFLKPDTDSSGSSSTYDSIWRIESVCQTYNDGEIFEEQGVRYQVHCSIDVQEANLDATDDNTFEACAQACNDFSNNNPNTPCYAGVAFQTSTGSAGCFLKATTDANAVSDTYDSVWRLDHFVPPTTCRGYADGDIYTENGVRYQVHCSTDVFAGNIGQSDDDTFEGCAQACNDFSQSHQDNACAAGVILKPNLGTASCIFKGSTANSGASNSYDSVWRLDEFVPGAQCQGHANGSIITDNGVDYQIYCNTDVPLGDLYVPDVETFADCAAACDQYSAQHQGIPCVAGVVNSAQQGGTGCHLKSSTNNGGTSSLAWDALFRLTAFPATECYGEPNGASFVEGGNLYQTSCYTDIPQADLDGSGATSIETFEACADKCNENSDCTAFVIGDDPTGIYCHLKATTDGQEPSDNYQAAFLITRGIQSTSSLSTSQSVATGASGSGISAGTSATGTSGHKSGTGTSPTTSRGTGTSLASSRGTGTFPTSSRGTGTSPTLRRGTGTSPSSTYGTGRAPSTSRQGSGTGMSPANSHRGTGTMRPSKSSGRSGTGNVISSHGTGTAGYGTSSRGINFETSSSYRASGSSPSNTISLGTSVGTSSSRLSSNMVGTGSSSRGTSIGTSSSRGISGTSASGTGSRGTSVSSSTSRPSYTLSSGTGSRGTSIGTSSSRSVSGTSSVTRSRGTSIGTSSSIRISSIGESGTGSRGTGIRASSLPSLSGTSSSGTSRRVTSVGTSSSRLSVPSGMSIRGTSVGTSTSHHGTSVGTPSSHKGTSVGTSSSRPSSASEMSNRGISVGTTSSRFNSSIVTPGTSSRGTAFQPSISRHGTGTVASAMNKSFSQRTGSTFNPTSSSGSSIASTSSSRGTSIGTRSNQVTGTVSHSTSSRASGSLGTSSRGPSIGSVSSRVDTETRVTSTQRGTSFSSKSFSRISLTGSRGTTSSRLATGSYATSSSHPGTSGRGKASAHPATISHGSVSSLFGTSGRGTVSFQSISSSRLSTSNRTTSGSPPGTSSYGTTSLRLSTSIRSTPSSFSETSVHSNSTVSSEPGTSSRGTMISRPSTSNRATASSRSGTISHTVSNTTTSFRLGTSRHAISSSGGGTNSRGRTSVGTASPSGIQATSSRISGGRTVSSYYNSTSNTMGTDFPSLGQIGTGSISIPPRPGVNTTAASSLSMIPRPTSNGTTTPYTSMGTFTTSGASRGMSIQQTSSRSNNPIPSNNHIFSSTFSALSSSVTSSFNTSSVKALTNNVTTVSGTATFLSQSVSTTASSSRDTGASIGSTVSQSSIGTSFSSPTAPSSAVFSSSTSGSSGYFNTTSRTDLDSSISSPSPVSLASPSTTTSSVVEPGSTSVETKSKTTLSQSFESARTSSSSSATETISTALDPSESTSNIKSRASVASSESPPVSSSFFSPTSVSSPTQTIKTETNANTPSLISTPPATTTPVSSVKSFKFQLRVVLRNSVLANLADDGSFRTDNTRVAAFELRLGELFLLYESALGRRQLQSQIASFAGDEKTVFSATDTPGDLRTEFVLSGFSHPITWTNSNFFKGAARFCVAGEKVYAVFVADASFCEYFTVLIAVPLDTQLPFTTFLGLSSTMAAYQSPPSSISPGSSGYFESLTSPYEFISSTTVAVAPQSPIFSGTSLSPKPSNTSTFPTNSTVIYRNITYTFNLDISVSIFKLGNYYPCNDANYFYAKLCPSCTPVEVYKEDLSFAQCRCPICPPDIMKLDSAEGLPSTPRSASCKYGQVSCLSCGKASRPSIGAANAQAACRDCETLNFSIAKPAPAATSIIDKGPAFGLPAILPFDPSVQGLRLASTPQTFHLYPSSSAAVSTESSLQADRLSAVAASTIQVKGMSSSLAAILPSNPSRDGMKSVPTPETSNMYTSSSATMSTDPGLQDHRQPAAQVKPNANTGLSKSISASAPAAAASAAASRTLPPLTFVCVFVIVIQKLLRSAYLIF